MHCIICQCIWWIIYFAKCNTSGSVFFAFYNFHNCMKRWQFFLQNIYLYFLHCNEVWMKQYLLWKVRRIKKSMNWMFKNRKEYFIINSSNSLRKWDIETLEMSTWIFLFRQLFGLRLSPWQSLYQQRRQHTMPM